MSRLRDNRKQAIETLKSSCPQMAGVIEDKGSFSLQVRHGTDLFTSLARSIAYQQLSGKAAATIYGRFEALFKDDQPVAAEAVNFSVQTLRSVGISGGSWMIKAQR